MVTAQSTMVFGFMNRNTDEDRRHSARPQQLHPTGAVRWGATHSLPGIRPGWPDGYSVNGARLPSRYRLSMAGTEVVWTLSSRGAQLLHSWTSYVSTAYEMSHDPRALGSLNPGIRFSQSGPEGNGRGGNHGSPNNHVSW